MRRSGEIICEEAGTRYSVQVLVLMTRYVSFRDFDWLLLIFVLMICGLGVMEIHSATMHTKFAGSHVRQIYWILGGVGAMFLISAVNYQLLLDRIHWFYIAGLPR